MNCPNPKCKTTGIPDEANFCPVCGQPIFTASNPWEENRQKQLQKANADLIEMKSKLIAFESERRKFFAKLMRLDSYVADIQTNTNIINENSRKQREFERIDDKFTEVGSIIVSIILIGYAVMTIINGYKDYQSLDIVGIDLSIIFDFVFSIGWKVCGVMLALSLVAFIIYLIIRSPYRQEQLVGNNSTLELQKFIKKYQELYSYMQIKLEDEIIDAEQNSHEILDKINDIDDKLNKIE